MSKIKNIHKKYGTAIYLDMIIESIVTQVISSKNISIDSPNTYVTLYEKADAIEEYIGKDLSKEIQEFHAPRKNLMHDVPYPFSKNKEFKDFLKKGKKIIRKLKKIFPFVNVPPILDDEKLQMVGKLVFQSTFVEQYVNKKCTEKNISLTYTDGSKKSIPQKITERTAKIKEKNLATKKIKYDAIRQWYKQRNQYFHSIDTLTTATVQEIETFINNINGYQ